MWALLSVFRSRRLSRPSALAACWALLLQALIPLVHAPPAPPTLGGVPAWALTSICHVGSAPAGTRPDRNHPGKQTPVPRPPLCPLCAGLHLAGTFVPPAAITLPAPSAISGVRFVGNDRAGSASVDRPSAQPRAPPVTA